MEAWSIAVIAVLVVATGVLLGVLASQRAARSRAATPAPAVALGEADLHRVLEALDPTAVLLGPGNEVLLDPPEANRLGLVRAGRLVQEDLTALADQVRETGGYRRAQLELARTPSIETDRLTLAVTLVALADGRVLLLAQDRTAQLRLDQVRRDFVANVSHELKTPVGAVALLAETLDVAADDPDDVREFAHRLTREARRLTGLVQDIIDLSRLQDADVTREALPVAVDEVVAQAVAACDVEAHSRDILLGVASAEGLRVLGDRGLLITALRNLIDNALRYSDEGTRVNVVPGLDEDGRVRIAVVDQGIGIEAAALPRVFERFYRVDPARSRNTGGTGLGLSIVKHVAQDHGGEVTVWSQPGRGSTFTLHLPRAVLVPDGAGPAAWAGAPSGGAPREPGVATPGVATPTSLGPLARTVPTDPTPAAERPLEGAS